MNPDLDLSTNVSTLDPIPASSNIDRIYSNMLTVPESGSDTTAGGKGKKKLVGRKSDPAGKKINSKSVVMITINDNETRDAKAGLRRGKSTDNSSFKTDPSIDLEPTLVTMDTQVEKKRSKVIRLRIAERLSCNSKEKQSKKRKETVIVAVSDINVETEVPKVETDIPITEIH